MTAEKKVSQSFYFQLGFNISALIIIILVTKLFKQTGFIWAMLSAYYFYICFVCIFLFKWIMPYISYEKAVKSLLLIFLYNIPFLLITHIACEQRQPVLIFIVATAVYFLAVILINQYVVVSKSTKLLLSEGMRAFLKRK